MEDLTPVVPNPVPSNTESNISSNEAHISEVESVVIGVTVKDKGRDCQCGDGPVDIPLLQQQACSPKKRVLSDVDCDSNYTMSGINLSKGTTRDQLHPFSSQASGASSWGTPARYIKGRPVPTPLISYDMTPFSSTLSSLSPLCRICQCSGDQTNILIHPCRCDGSLRFIHGTCLRKWIEVSSRKAKTVGPATCELCGFIYRKHKFIKCRNWQCPKVTVRDKALHTIFIVSLVIMIGCAVATVMCFITDREQLAKYKSELNQRSALTTEEIITLSCGVAFFVSFFVAMSVEIKAKHTIYQIFRKCLRYNTVWIIENYNPHNDRECNRAAQHHLTDQSSPPPP